MIVVMSLRLLYLHFLQVLRLVLLLGCRRSSTKDTRSYGIGLARAAAAAGLVVLECEQPHRNTRRGRGKSDPIDAHLAVLAALRLHTDRLPIPRADGDREALRILLGARQEMTTATTAQTNRLRALLLGGDDTDRELARGALTDTRLGALARRRAPREATREQAIRHAEIRRLALALRDAARALKDNRAQLHTIVNDLVRDCRTARAAARGRRTAPHQPKTTPGLGGPGRVRRPDPAAASSTALPSPGHPEYDPAPASLPGAREVDLPNRLGTHKLPAPTRCIGWCGHGPHRPL